MFTFYREGITYEYRFVPILNISCTSPASSNGNCFPFSVFCITVSFL